MAAVLCPICGKQILQFAGLLRGCGTFGKFKIPRVTAQLSDLVFISAKEAGTARGDGDQAERGPSSP